MLQDRLEAILRKWENDESLTVKIVSKTPNCATSAGFLSASSIVKVEGARKSGEPYSASFFVKELPDESKVVMFNIKQLFSNELIAYSDLIAQLPAMEPYICKCLGGGEDLIVLEDLSSKGYATPDKKDGLNVQQAEILMKAISTFHAGTFDFSVKKREECDILLSKLGKWTMMEKMTSLMPLLLNFIIGCLSQDESLTKYIPKIQEIFKPDDAKHKLLDLFHSDRLPVIIHGDFWTNNFLFKLTGGQEQLVLIDFQGIQFGSPAVDLWTFFYTSMAPQLLNTHYDHLVSIYMSNFIQTLRNLNTPTIPSEEELKQEIESREMFGLIYGLTCVPAMNMDLSKMPANVEELFQDPNLVERFGIRPSQSLVDKLITLTKRAVDRNLL